MNAISGLMSLNQTKWRVRFGGNHMIHSFILDVYMHSNKRSISSFRFSFFFARGESEKALICAVISCAR